MLQCGDSICLLCFDDLLQPQESKLICPHPQCNEVLIINDRFKSNIMKIKEQSMGLGIFCSQHMNCEAEQYCMKHNVMVCDKCALKFHKDHTNMIIEAKRKDIDKFCEKTIKVLHKVRDKINQIYVELESYLSHEKIFSSQLFMETVNDAREMLIGNFIDNLDFLKEQIQEQKVVKQNHFNDELQFEDEQKENDNEDKSIKIQQPIWDIKQDIDADQIEVGLDLDRWIGVPEESRKIFFIGQPEIKALREWIGFDCQLELVYKASRDGFTANSFYQMCKNASPTISFIKSQRGQVFGGYTTIPWQKVYANNISHSDPEAFTFSLTNLTKHEQYQNQIYAIKHHKSYFLGFGGNWLGNNEFLFYDNCDKQGTKAYAGGFGYTYKPPDGIKVGSVEAINYLAGSEYFKVTEIETYKCIKI